MKKLIFSFLSLLIAFAAIAQVADSIPAYVKKADWSKLTACMDDNVDLMLLDNEDLYTKAEASKLIRTFFTDHPVDSFKIMHAGSSKMDAKFKIGEYSSGSDQYRITYFLHDTGGKMLIRQFRVEKL